MSSKRSRSLSPAPTNASAGLGGVTADHALLATLAWFAFIALSMVINPGWLMGLYEIPLDSLKAEAVDWIVAQQILQAWGIWLSLLLGVVSVVKRDGSKNDKSLLCLGNVIGCVMSLASTALKGMDLSRQMGMPDEGAYVNIGITVGLATLSFLGWQSSGAAMPDLSLLTAMGGDKDANRGRSLSNRFTILLCALFGLAMTFNLDALLVGYHFTQEGLLKTWAASVFTGMGITLLMTATCMTFLLGASAKCSASLTRFQWAFFIAVFVQTAAAIPSMQLINPAMHAARFELPGVYFNLALWFIAYALHHLGMVGQLPFVGALQ